MYDDDTGEIVDSDTMKKAGVIAVIVLLALYIVGYIIIAAVAGLSLTAVIVYGVIATLLLIVLVYEGWQRFKEIDEGLEDAVDDY